MDDLDLWNRRHKIKKQKLILEIKSVLDADYKIGLRFFLQKVEGRKYQWDVDQNGKEKSITVLIDVIEHVLQFEQDSSFPVRPMHEKAIKSILRNYKIDELLNERGSYKQLYNLDGETYSIKLTDRFIYFMFEEIKETIDLKENRYVGIDLNPEFIGISIKEDDQVIHTKLYSLKKLTDKIIGLKVSSQDKRFKNLNNKLNHEVLEISKDISNLSKEFNCKFIFVEDLSFKGNTRSNRKNKNLWKREILINNLTKRCNINNQRLFKVNPAYSSFIGNLQHNYDDPINASIEIGRRGYECIIKKNKQFYPELKLKEELIHQWKDKINLDNFKTWKELFMFIKNLELRYRVSTGVVFREFKTIRSLVGYINHQSYLCV